MIIIDYHAVAVSTAAGHKLDVEEALLRHTILNSIRAHRMKYHKKFGDVVVAMEGKNNWRYKAFPQYKAARSGAKDASSIDWDSLIKIIVKVGHEIRDNFPYKVVEVDRCEADDVIAQLVESTQEFGNNEPVMIISGDKDFAQLQRYSNVFQYAPVQRKQIIEKDPELFLKTHILRGDRSDGIPNVLSPDHTFVEGLRQKTLYQKTIDELLIDPKCMGEEVYKNYLRNKQLIDLQECPQDIKNEIMKVYNDIDTDKNKGKILNYLINHKCMRLIETAGDFTNG